MLKLIVFLELVTADVTTLMSTTNNLIVTTTGKSDCSAEQ